MTNITQPESTHKPYVFVCFWAHSAKIKLRKKAAAEKKKLAKKTPRYRIFYVQRKWPQIHFQKAYHTCYLFLSCIPNSFSFFNLKCAWVLWCCFSFSRQNQQKRALSVSCVVVCMERARLFVCAHFSRWLSNSFFGPRWTEYILCTGQRSSSPKNLYDISGTCLCC